jgi:hypothetical protein
LRFFNFSIIYCHNIAKTLSPISPLTFVVEILKEDTMTLHEEIVQILKETKIPLSTSQISDLVNKRKNYIKNDGSEVSPFQIHGRTRNYSKLFLKNKSMVGLKGRDEKIIEKIQYDNPAGGDYRAHNPIINQISNKSIAQQTLEYDEVHKKDFLTKSGFKKIGTIQELQKNNFPRIHELDSPGIYVITKTPDYQPDYFTPEECKIKGNVINPWLIQRLVDKWLDEVDILYYGLAGANSPRSLKSRLTDLINHSKGLISDRGPHKGGEIIWQLKGFENFEIWILPTGNPPEPRNMEEKLLKQFFQITGQLPFANRKF